MKKLQFNPIWRKEIKLGSRSIKFPLAVMAYAGILSLVAVGILNGATSYDYYWNMTNGMDYAALTDSFSVLAYVQLGLICIIMPVLTAGSIAGERERQTLDIMLTAPVSPFSIVMGKLWSALSNVFLFVIGSLPAMAICFLYGGIQWQYLLIFVLEIMVIAFFTGAIGIWCSSVFKKTIVSVIMTLVFEFIFYMVPLWIVIGAFAVKSNQLMAAGLTDTPSLGNVPLIMLLDPAFGAVDGIGSACYGYSIAHMVFTEGLYGTFETAPFVQKISAYWSWISLVVTILLGFGFAFLAARRIDSVRLKGKRMKKKKEQA